MSNADDRPPCAECGDTWGAGVHDYAHPYRDPREQAPQPAPNISDCWCRKLHQGPCPQPAPSAITVKVVVNGHPTEVSVEPRCTMRRLVELAIEKTGMIGRPIDDWRVRDDEGYEYPLDEWKISPQFPPDTKLWLFLGVGKCSAEQPAPSGDEAKVREIANKWYAQYVGSHLPALQHGILPGAVREAYCAGKADEREGCEKLLRARADVAYVITDPGAVRERKALHFAAEAIARRGKEGA